MFQTIETHSSPIDYTYTTDKLHRLGKIIYFRYKDPHFYVLINAEHIITIRHEEKGFRIYLTNGHQYIITCPDHTPIESMWHEAITYEHPKHTMQN